MPWRAGNTRDASWAQLFRTNPTKLTAKPVPFGLFSSYGFVAMTSLFARCTAQVTTDHSNWTAYTQGCHPEVLYTLKGLPQASEVHLAAFLQKINKTENYKLVHSLPWSQQLFWLVFLWLVGVFLCGFLFVCLWFVFFLMGSVLFPKILEWKQSQ